MTDELLLPSDNETKEDRERRVANALNRQGYSFQHAVIRRLEQLCMGDPAHWHFLGAEFPVTANGNGTRIDLVFGTHNTPFWMIGECKRVNPAFSDWCFFRSPYIAGAARVDFVAECARYHPIVFGSTSVTIAYNTGQNYYNVALSVKSGKKGDPSGGGERAIEESASQVCIGINGMVNFLQFNQSLLSYIDGIGERILIPIIVTTARLLTSEADISSADVLSGLIEPKQIPLEEKPFVFYQYPVSPGIRNRTAITDHSELFFQKFNDLPAALIGGHIRTIAVVNAAGIETFVKQFHPLNFQVVQLSRP